MTRFNCACYILCILSTVAGTAVLNLLIWGKGFFLRESTAWKSLGMFVGLFIASLAMLLANFVFSENTRGPVKDGHRDFEYGERPPTNIT
jgi:hypothetical protein